MNINIFNKPIVKNSVIYFFFNGLNNAIPFFLLPVLTYYLSPADYGNVAIFSTSIALVIPIVGLSMGTNIDRLFFKIRKEDLAITIFNMVCILIVTTIICIICLKIFNRQSEVLIGLPLFWIIIIPVISFFSVLTEFNLILLRDLNKSITFGFWQSGNTLLNISISLFLIIIIKAGWQGRAYGIGISVVLIGTLSFINIVKRGYFKIHIDKNKIIDTLQVCFPLIFHSLGGFIIFQSDRYFINLYVGKSGVGIYAIAYSFASLVLFTQDAIAKAVNPWFYKNLANIDNVQKKKIVRVNHLYNLVLIALAVAVSIISYFLVRIMTTSKFHQASSFILWLTLGFAFNGMYKMMSVYFIHLGKTNILAATTFFSALISITLNSILVKQLGIIGAAYSFALSFFLHFILVWIIASKLYPMPWIDFYKFKK